VLLLDEPATGLDPAAAAALHERLGAHRARGGCALLVSHDLAGTLAVSDRFVMLRAGQVTAEGPAAGADAAQLIRSHFAPGSAA
jgi:ABC-type sulfate/molybdate transport systems ATPase subunit